MEIIIVLGLLALSVAFFAFEWLSVDITTLILLIALVVTRILTPSEAFAGFSNHIIIILASIFIISGALQSTRIMDAVADRLSKIAGASETPLLAAVMIVVGSVSAFMNNTTATAIFVPAVIALANKANVGASKLLMPMAYGSIRRHLYVHRDFNQRFRKRFYLKSGMPPLTMFEVTPIGIVLVGVGTLYLLIIGKRTKISLTNMSCASI